MCNNKQKQISNPINVQCLESLARERCSGGGVSNPISFQTFTYGTIPPKISQSPPPILPHIRQNSLYQNVKSQMFTGWGGGKQGGLKKQKSDKISRSYHNVSKTSQAGFVSHQSRGDISGCKNPISRKTPTPIRSLCIQNRHLPKVLIYPFPLVIMLLGIFLKTGPHSSVILSLV